MVRKTLWMLALAMAVAVAGSTSAYGHPGHQHGEDTGHLHGFGAWGNVQLVSQLRVHDAARDIIADLTVFKNYAYISKWGAPDCAGPEKGGQNSPDGGAYVIDISNLSQPREVGFIATSQDTLVGEGMQAVTLTTPFFSGDVLVMNHEGCGKNYKGGFSLWNITNPLKPARLVEHAGDHLTRKDVNTYHSAFAWDTGDNAYLIATDNEEPTDVDIYDITDPRKPKLVSEPDLNVFDVSQPSLALTDSFNHDFVVKQIGNRWIALICYWDGGYVLLDVTNPASPKFLGDSDYAPVDPELLAQTGVSLSPEGNGHQGEFTLDNRFAITTDEDFGPHRLQVATSKGTFLAKPGSNTTVDAAKAVSGTTVFVGRACPGDPPVPAAPSVGTKQVAVVERGLCLFEEKAQAVIAAGGYESMLIMNREGADACTGVLVPSLTAPITTVLFGRDSGFAMFGLPFDQATCADATLTQAPIAIGTLGAPISGTTAAFDGWGYVHLFRVDLGANSGTLTDLDTFAIPEAMNEAFATGFGDLSVHEVATEKTDASRAFLSYYAGGIRAIQIQCTSPANPATCKLVETGGYLDPEGNNFWGIETFVRNGVTYAAGSDMDHGIWIVKRTP